LYLYTSAVFLGAVIFETRCCRGDDHRRQDLFLLGVRQVKLTQGDTQLETLFCLSVDVEGREEGYINSVNSESPSVSCLFSHPLQLPHTSPSPTQQSQSRYTMTDNTHTPSNTSSTNGSVVGTPPSSPRATTFVDTSAHDLFHPYPPTHPGFVSDADWIDLYNPDLVCCLFAASGQIATHAHTRISQFDEAPYSANEDTLQGNVTACNNVTAGYAPFDDIPIEEQQCEEEDEQVTEAFVSWYKAQVAAGVSTNTLTIYSVLITHVL
jgi:hypothetical protein